MANRHVELVTSLPSLDFKISDHGNQTTEPFFVVDSMCGLAIFKNLTVPFAIERE
jgi:hypothetical protein